MPEFTTRGLRGTVVGLYDRRNDLLGVGLVVRVYPDRASVLTKVDSRKIEWLEFGRVRAARRLLS
jgi:polynucleotide 5'-kinase involved in rRNA processing